MSAVMFHAVTYCLHQCLRASKDLIRTLVDNIGVPELRTSPSCSCQRLYSQVRHVGIYLRHGPDSECVFVTFTCAFLIKVHILALLSSVLC